MIGVNYYVDVCNVTKCISGVISMKKLSSWYDSNNFLLLLTMGIKPVADFETLNYKIMTDLNTSTEATITTETAIGFIPCYRQGLLILKSKYYDVRK
jgi:hypothetical protein